MTRTKKTFAEGDAFHDETFGEGTVLFTSADGNDTTTFSPGTYNTETETVEVDQFGEVVEINEK